MKRCAAEDLEYTKRYGALVAQHAIQDFYDLMVELISNSDDSYHRQYVDGASRTDGGQILIEIERHHAGTPSVVTVKDRAGGFDDLFNKLRHVGARTSRPGDRGFMARGLKDCAALGHITVETIADNQLSKAEVTPSMKLVSWTPESATEEHRNRLGIPRGTGTVVRVELNPNIPVPRLETLKRELPWYYALRDIMAEESDSTILVAVSGGKPEPVRWVKPESDLIHDREYTVPGYDDARFRFRLWKSRQPLEDPADKRHRRTGVLVKGARGIHGASSLATELEHDPAAGHFFGRIDCAAIDRLAEDFNDRLERDLGDHPADNPMLILDPNRRGGLADGHPYTRALYTAADSGPKGGIQEAQGKGARSQTEG